MLLYRLVAAGLLLQMMSPIAEARLLRRRSAHMRGGSISLRRRLHINPLITEPGTVEVEWNNAWTTSEAYTMPSTIKWTPEGSHVWWGRTELSANFDVVSSVAADGERVTHASDHVTLAGTALIKDGEHWNVAVAPLVTLWLRDQSGMRAGATAIGRYDLGRNSAGVTLQWTGATAASDNNPAGTWDFGGGYGRSVGARLTLHGDAQFERSTGFVRTWSIFEGVEYQFTERIAVDLSGQHLTIAGGTPDHQVLLGFTINLGNPARWFR